MRLPRSAWLCSAATISICTQQSAKFRDDPGFQKIVHHLTWGPWFSQDNPENWGGGLGIAGWPGVGLTPSSVQSGVPPALSLSIKRVRIPISITVRRREDGSSDSQPSARRRSFSVLAGERASGQCRGFEEGLRADSEQKKGWLCTQIPIKSHCPAPKSQRPAPGLLPLAQIGKRNAGLFLLAYPFSRFILPGLLSGGIMCLPT